MNSCLSLQMNNTTVNNPLDKFFIFSTLSLFEWCTFLTVFPALVFLYLVVLFVVYANKSGNFSGAYFVLLFNHGLCDMFLALFTVYTIILDTAQKFLLGLIFDNFRGFLFFSCYLATQIFSALIATNRFFTIVFFKRFQTYFTVRQARIQSIIAILIACMINAPIFIKSGFSYLPLTKVCF